MQFVANVLSRLLRTEIVNFWDYSEAATSGFLLKKAILKISLNSQENTCVGVPTLININVSGLQIYKKEETPTEVFSCKSSKIFQHTFFFRTPPNYCFWILQLKIKLLKTKFLIDGFIINQFHIQIILHSNKYQKTCK